MARYNEQSFDDIIAVYITKLCEYNTVLQLFILLSVNNTKYAK